MNLYEQTKYLTPPRFISGRIIEYDIKSANVSMLYEAGLITKELREYYENMPKHDREVAIGLMIRKDRSYYNAIQTSIKKYKRLFFESNNLNDSQIVRIANDAVYVNTSFDLQYTKFDSVEFRVKSISTSYIKLLDLLIFLNSQNDLQIDVKGINEKLLPLHEPMITFIANIMVMLEWGKEKEALTTVTDFIEDYINRKLDISYYRELNSFSLYRVSNLFDYLVFKNGTNSVCLDTISDINSVDINWNLSILRELWSIVFEKINIRRQ